MIADLRDRWGDVGLWGGFLDRLPAAEAVAAVRAIEASGIGTIWLQEYSGVDPFARAMLYLSATDHLVVAIGVAVIHFRDPEAMVAVASTVEDAFPGRFVLGLGVSHRDLVEARGHHYGSPVTAMEGYLADMDRCRGRRRIPPTLLGALGPRMTALAARRADGVHSYFSPVAHTGAARTRVGPDGLVVPSQMVCVDAGAGWRDQVRPYLGLCLGMANYTANLVRHGLSQVDVAEVSDRLIDALVVPADSSAVQERLAAQRAAGADQVVLQLVPPPPAPAVLERLPEVVYFTQ